MSHVGPNQGRKGKKGIPSDEPNGQRDSSRSSFDGHEMHYREVLVAELSASDEPTHRRCKCLMICVNGHVRWRLTASSTR
jgi:hypothetical protein